MPLLRRRARLRRTELTPRQRLCLETGRDGHPGSAFQGEVRKLREAWELHKAEILPEFIARHPGQRPFAWYLCDHGKERPVIVPGWTSERKRHWLECNRGRRPLSAYAYGFAHDHSIAPLPAADGQGFTWHPVQEPEWQYLQRLGLMSAAELQALAAVPLERRK